MKHLRRFCLLCLISLTSMVYAQHIGVSTNALYWATVTPNASVHFRTSQKTSVNLEVAAHPYISVNGYGLRFVNFSPEVRFWFGRNGIARPFWGVAAQSALYSGQWEDNNHKGSLIGGGLTIGYNWTLSERFNLEVTAGAGVMYIRDTSTPIYSEGTPQPVRGGLITPAPIKLGVNFIYFIR